MKNDQEILKLLEDIVKEFSYYGYRKVTAILQYREGITINRKRVYRIMKQHHLLIPASHSHKKLFRGIPFSYNLDTDRSNQLWGIDMTYIWCGADGWGYFHGVIDHHDKTLLGYHFSRSCKAIGGVMALSEAASKREVENLELRSDNGCHYGAKLFRDELRRLDIYHTRTMVNTPKGNAIIERFFRSLKEECVWQHRFENFEQAKEAVDGWVKHYNQTRPHQTLDYLAPDVFYQQSSLRSAA